MDKSHKQHPGALTYRTLDLTTILLLDLKELLAFHHGTKSVALVDNKMSLNRENPHARLQGTANNVMNE